VRKLMFAAIGSDVG